MNETVTRTAHFAVEVRPNESLETQSKLNISIYIYMYTVYMCIISRHRSRMFSAFSQRDLRRRFSLRAAKYKHCFSRPFRIPLPTTFYTFALF